MNFDKLIFDGQPSSSSLYNQMNDNSFAHNGYQQQSQHSFQGNQNNQESHSKNMSALYQQNQQYNNNNNNNNNNVTVDNDNKNMIAQLREQHNHQPYPEEDQDLKMEFLKDELKGLQIHLENYGYPQVGDFFNPTTENVEKTLKVMYALIQQRQCDIDFRKEQFDKQQTLERDKLKMRDQLQKALQKCQQLEQDKDKGLHRFTMLDKKFKEEMAAKDFELKEMANNFNKIQSREAQFLNDIRKKDLQIKKFGDQIKNLQDKNQHFINGVQFTSTLANSKLNYNENTLNNQDFANVMTQNYENQQLQILQENELLKDGLESIHKELSDMLMIRKEIFIRRRKLQSKNDEFNEEHELNDIDLIPFNKELFQIPTQVIGRNAINLLQENVKRFREFMDKVDELQSDMEAEKMSPEEDQELENIKSISNLKNLLQNYKYVVNCQDSLLQKAIIKANDFQMPADINFNKGRFSKIMDDKEIQKARQFLLEQKQFLEQKNKDLESTRQMMSETVQKIEQEKNIVIARRQEVLKEADTFKSNVIHLMQQHEESAKKFRSCSQSEEKQSNQVNNNNNDDGDYQEKNIIQNNNSLNIQNQLENKFTLADVEQKENDFNGTNSSLNYYNSVQQQQQEQQTLKNSGMKQMHESMHGNAVPFSQQYLQQQQQKLQD